MGKQMLTRCRTCVYPTTKPDLNFVDGQCAACRNYEARPYTDWQQRLGALRELLAAAPVSKDGFNCIVPSSGGKDSTAQVIMLLELGAKPLIVTASTCYLTQLGAKNIDNLKRFAPTLEVDPDWNVRRELNILGHELVGDISWPEHAAIFSVPFRVAVERGISLVVYGELAQNEYGGPVDSEKAMSMTKRWVSEFGGLLGLRPDDLVGQNGIAASDMAYYSLPPEDDMAKVNAIFLGQFIPWSSHGNARIAIDHHMRYELPSQANWWAWENLDNAMTGIHDHGMYRKFGYGRLAGQISVDIRRNMISRAAAMDEVRARDGLFPNVYAGVDIRSVLAYLGKNYDWLLSNLDIHTSWDLFSEESQERGDLKPILVEFAEEHEDA